MALFDTDVLVQAMAYDVAQRYKPDQEIWIDTILNDVWRHPKLDMELLSYLMEDCLHDIEDIGEAHTKDMYVVFIHEETFWMSLRMDCHHIRKSSTDNKDSKVNFI